MIKLNGNKVDFKEFPNGETLLEKEGLYISKINAVHFKYEGDADLIKLLFLKRFLDEQGVLSNLLIYYMPYSRMDRSENGSPFTLKYVSEFINSLNFGCVEIIEAHSDVTLSLIEDVHHWLVNEEHLPLVIEEVNFNISKDYIVFPDAGAKSRYKSFAYPNVLTGNKIRDFSTGKILGLEIEGRITHEPNKAIIVDDLSSYGGTFVGTAEKLRELGFKEIYLLVAHAENSIFKGNLFDSIDKLFTTDSILTEQNNLEYKKYEDQLHIFSIE